MTFREATAATDRQTALLTLPRLPPPFPFHTKESLAYTHHTMTLGYSYDVDENIQSDKGPYLHPIL